MEIKNVKNANRFQLVDLSGRIHLTAQANESGSIDLNEQNNGVYIFTIVSEDGTVLNSLKKEMKNLSKGNKLPEELNVNR